MDRSIPVLRLVRERSFTLADPKDRQQNIDRWIRDTLNPALDNAHMFAPSYIGADIGRSGHASSICLLQVMEGMVRQVRLILEMWHIPFANQRQIFHHIMTKAPRLDRVHIDARGLGMELAEALQDAFGRKIVEGIMTADKWYRDAMPQMRHAFESKLIRIPADPDVRQDLRDIEIIRGVPKISEKAERKGINGQMRHADSAISITMAYAASSGGGLSYEYESAPDELIEQFEGAW
jgi:phage FluMu gp28-like protein